MKHVTLILAMLTYLASPVRAQNKTYIGFEFSMANDLYTIKDNGEYLKTVPLVNAQWGFNLRQDISKKIFIETGFIIKYYDEGIGFKTMQYWGTAGGDNSWLIPIRFGLKLNLFKEKVRFVPIIGYSFGINPPYGEGTARGTQKSSSITVIYSYTENPNVSRYFSLLQTGAGFEFQPFNSLLFLVSANYYKGFNTIYQLDIDYTINNSSPSTGTATSTGDFWCVSTGIKYSISNLWTKK